ncbi:MAG: hypothetical protein AAF225_05240 [Pseudomonadota bacterium]
MDEFVPASLDQACDALDVRGLAPLALFGFINSSAVERRVLVVEARSPPTLWFQEEPEVPPDLRSRLAAAPVVEVDRPSESDLRSVLAADLKLHGQRLSETDLEFVAERLPRDLGAPRRFCRELDELDARHARREQLQQMLEKVHVAPLKPF